MRYTKKDWLDYFDKHSYNGRLYVNCKYRPQLKDHASLRKLIKLGVLKQKREHTWYPHGTTYLIKP